MAERFSTTARIRAFGSQAAARVYRAQSRRLRRPPRRSRLTGRAALLALVVCSLVVALAYPLREYIAQRAEIAEQRRELEEAREEVDRLRDEKARWQDPAYAERQAREHLQYVRPGETGYTYKGSGDKQNGKGASAGGLSDSDAAAEGPWYDNLWDAVDRADRADRAGGTG